MGERLPSCSASSFPRQAGALIPESLRAAVEPLLNLIEQFTGQIRCYEREIEKLCEEKYPETAGLRQIKGVGALTCLAYILVLEDPHRFGRSREVGKRSWPEVASMPRNERWWPSAASYRHCWITGEENEGQMAAPTITNPYRHPVPSVELIQSANGSKAKNRLSHWVHPFWLVNYLGDAYKRNR